MRTGSLTRVSKKARGGQLHGRRGKYRRGTSVDTADANHLMSTAQPAGEFGATLPPTERAWADAVAAGLCPICGQGPYKLLGGHTHHAHGISANEVKERAGIPKSGTTASPDLTATLSDRGKQQINRSTPPHGQQTLSAAGRRRQAENMRKVRAALTPDQVAAFQAKGRATLIANAQRNTGIRKEPVACKACGTMHTRYRKITCSEECRAELAKRGGTTRKENRGDRCSRGHAFDGVKEDGARSCSTCQQIYQQAYRARQRAAKSPLTDEEKRARHERRVRAGKASAVARAKARGNA